LELEDEIRTTFDQMANPDSPDDPPEPGDGEPKGKGRK
jgi:hypothetical protein